jgi:hypothetical protein
MEALDSHRRYMRRFGIAALAVIGALLLAAIARFGA